MNSKTNPAHLFKHSGNIETKSQCSYVAAKRIMLTREIQQNRCDYTLQRTVAHAEKLSGARDHDSNGGFSARGGDRVAGHAGLEEPQTKDLLAIFNADSETLILVGVRKRETSEHADAAYLNWFNRKGGGIICYENDKGRDNVPPSLWPSEIIDGRYLDAARCTVLERKERTLDGV